MSDLDVATRRRIRLERMRLIVREQLGRGHVSRRVVQIHTRDGEHLLP